MNSLSTRFSTSVPSTAPAAVSVPSPLPTTLSINVSAHSVLAALAVATVLVLGILVMTAHSTRGIVSASTRVTQAQHTVALAGQLLATVNDAEAAERQFLRSAEEKHLAPYEAARARYPGELADLQAQLDPHLELATLSANLRTQLDAKFAEFVHTIDLRRSEGLEPALAIAASDASWRNSTEIRSLLQTLQTGEFDELAAHADAVARRAESFQALGLGFAEIAIALTALGGWLLLRRVRPLERVAKICAWTRRVLCDGQWVSFEEYLSRRFGVESTHGICDEAARQMEKEILATPLSAELRASAD